MLAHIFGYSARNTSLALAGTIILALAIAPESGCRRRFRGLSSGSSSGSSTTKDGVTEVAADNAAMLAAIAKSRETVDTFILRLKSPQPGDSEFAVMVPLTYGGKTEHLWLSDVRFDGAQFKGKATSNSSTVSRIKEGQERKINRDEISDWMYVSNGKLVGGRTIRVLRDMMSSKERAAYDANSRFTFD